MTTGHRITSIVGMVLLGFSGSEIHADDFRPSPPQAEIARSAEGRQCEPGSGLSVHEMQRELTVAGIEVLSASCGIMTGVQFITVCGAFDGGLNVYTIPSTNLERALALGFQETSSLPGNEPGWQPVSCPEERES